MQKIDILELKEGLNVEFKTAEKGVPKSFYETYSSFSNTAGGDIYLGIEELPDKELKIVGVKDCNQYIKFILDTTNNKAKVSFNTLTDDSFEIINVDGKNVLKVHINELPRGKKPLYLNDQIANSYVRRGEGDYLATKSELISFIYDQQEDGFDFSINTFGYDFSDISIDSLHSFRRHLENRNTQNSFKEMSDEDFCVKMRFLKSDSSNRLFLTNAAVLLLTNIECISSIYPNYFVDYQEKIYDSIRWDYRLTSIDEDWSCNLMDYFDGVIGRIKTKLPTPYETENGIEVSGEDIYRAVIEAVINALVNADFYNGNSIIIRVYANKIEFINSGKPLVSIDDMIMGGITNPRNKELMRYFRLLRYAQRSGYGVQNIFSTMKKYKYPVPIMTENEEQKTTNLTMIFERIEGNPSIKVSSSDVVSFIGGAEDGVSQKELIEHFKADRKTILNVINSLIAQGMIKTNAAKTKGKKYYLK